MKRSYKDTSSAWLRGLTAMLLVVSLATQRGLAAESPSFLILAPDRGFLGNEEVREVFKVFQARLPNSALVFATTERTEENLQRALSALARQGDPLSEVVVLPLFLSERHVLYRKVRAVLQQMDYGMLRFARPFGESYLAEEILFDRVEALLSQRAVTLRETAAVKHGGHGGAGRPLQVPARNERLVLVAGGAGSVEDEGAIEVDLAPLLRHTVERFGFKEGRIVVYSDASARDASFKTSFEKSLVVLKAAAEQGPLLIVPFNFSPRPTTMMSVWNLLQRNLESISGAIYDGQGVLPHPNVLRWLIRTANGYLPLAREDIGVILVPHGSDFNWNEAMREAISPLRERYVMEEAFSMVDPHVVERAVRRLEEKGKKAAVLVRIFSLESSFRQQAEYILGLRTVSHAPHLDRIASYLRFVTVGGLEAHPYLAGAMLDRALDLSRDPSKETVILLAHGSGEDTTNAHWMGNLARLAAYVRAHGGGRFRAIRYHTWREDWPDKRGAAIEAIRAMVEDAARDGGTALVLPVRTIGRGPEEKYLQGLTYRYGTGFAPHPGFVKWLEDVIEQGITMLTEPNTDKKTSE